MDPVDMAMGWVAQYGWLGLVGVALFERLVPVLPSHGLLVVIGIGCAQGYWGLLPTLLVTALTSVFGCLLIYAAARLVNPDLSRAGLVWLAGLFGIREAKVRNWMALLQDGEGGFAFFSQSFPVLRELAPGLAGLLRVQPLPYFARATAGILVWNGLFLTSGMLAGLGSGPANVTWVAGATLASLLLVELALFVAWRRVAALRRAVFNVSLRARRWKKALSRADIGLFLRAWWHQPGLVGAVAPSGQALGRLITAEVEPDSGPVIELGPGTGVFTRALLARGVPRQSLVLVEADAGFAHDLRRRFPGVRVLCMDAAQLGHSGGFFGMRRAASVISGLPLLAMPIEKRIAIVKGAFQRHLLTAGAFYQFTYLPRCPIPAPTLEALGLYAERIGSAFANLPPAFVYRIRQLPLQGK